MRPCSDGEGVDAPQRRRARGGGRLLAYALPAGAGTPAQRDMIDEALSFRPLPAGFRGAAPTLARLVGKWATDPDYARKIARIANEISGA